MKIFLSILFLIASNLIVAQDFYLKILPQNSNTQKVIDSVGYKQKHAQVGLIVDYINQLSTEFTSKGYLQSRFSDPIKSNDSTFVYQLDLGSQVKLVSINTKNVPNLKSLGFIQTDSVEIPFSEVESYLTSLINQLEIKGYSMSKIKLDDFEFQNSILKANLFEEITLRRNLNDIVILGYNKFPQGFKKQLKRMYRKRTFNQFTLKDLFDDVNKMSFVNQSKKPEVLFTQDSTKVFLYLEKAKANNFDGYVGFTSDENGNVIFTGYLDLLLNNALNSGERFKLYWKNDGNNQQSFDFSGELPYVFQSPVALRGNLNIFKQDSTFQTSKTNIELGYYFKFNKRLYLGYQTLSSNDIQSVYSSSLSDLESKFYTSTFEYFVNNREEVLFTEKLGLIVNSGFGKKQLLDSSESQYYMKFEAFNNFYLNQKNLINVKLQGFYLNSDTYQINELHRFGGINSVRGFNENSLQANTYFGLMAEYRYVLSPSMYVNTITDYAYFQDSSMQIKNRLMGLGFGIGLFTNSGLFKLVYANGNVEGQQIKLSNSIMHLSYKVSF